MAMLAGPRRKQKVINLRAKNNAWSNDNSKFGQRMLEKMGWSAGKGLGANENGIVEHVVARYKNDEKGLGFEDKNDQWTKHEDDFNSLLANLSNSNDNKDKLHSGVSLEVKSKKSKARVHYHKFTRGKDLSRYTEKDLANIFGKKSLKVELKSKETSKEDVKAADPIFTEKGSMDDYFKNKLANLKSKQDVSLASSVKSDDYQNANYGFQGFAESTYNSNEEDHQDFGFQSFSFYSKNDKNEDHILKDGNCHKLKKLKNDESKCEASLDYDENNYSLINRTKKNKKKLKSNDCSNSEDKSIIYEESQPTKKKKRKHLDNENVQNPKIDEAAPRKKKNKNKDQFQDVQDTVSEDTNEPKKKKKRKNKKPEN